MGAMTVDALRARKRTGPRLTMLTAYDVSVARALDATDVDCILVGDSLGMVVLGYESTAAVTMAEMLHHTKAVRRGVTRALLIGDLPLEALRGAPEETVRQARRFADEGGCDAVKVEWREGMERVAAQIIGTGLPVMGHVGLTPQTAAAEGGYGTRAKDADAAARVIEQAASLERAGCFALVLECVPQEVAAAITERVGIPTFGIGSGPACDGQVLVTYDLVGLFDRFRPRFVRRYADVAGAIRTAASAYVRDVQAGTFPGPGETVRMKPEECARLAAKLQRP